MTPCLIFLLVVTQSPQCEPILQAVRDWDRDCRAQISADDFRGAQAGKDTIGKYASEVVASGEFSFEALEGMSPEQTKECEARMETTFGAVKSAEACKPALETWLKSWTKTMESSAKSLNDKLVKELAQYRSADGYGSSRWGMSAAEVRKVAPGLTDKDKNGKSLRRKDTVAGFPVDVSYDFAANHLAQVLLVINTNHIRAQEHVTDFTKLREALTEKYGEPAEDGVTWDNDTLAEFTNDEGLGMQVHFGHAKINAQWQTGSTIILLSTRAYEGVIKTSVGYGSVELHDLLTTLRAREAGEKL